MSYRPLARPDELQEPRWLCANCGCTRGLDGPAYPRCACGSQMRMVDSPELPYVGTPAERLESARAEYDEVYGRWVNRLRSLRADLDAIAEARGMRSWLEEWIAQDWRGLRSDAELLARLAEHVDRIEAETGGAV